MATSEGKSCATLVTYCGPAQPSAAYETPTVGSMRDLGRPEAPQVRPRSAMDGSLRNMDASMRAMDAPIARQYMTTAVRSNSLVCLAADKSRMSDLLTLVRSVGPFLAALKTHVDVVEDWTDEGWKEVRAAADDVDLLLFEDRKFADIGGITQKQMHGMYGIASWADLVTAHLISGPDIVDGCMAAWADVGRSGGVLLLAQMSSRGNLLAGASSKRQK